MAKQKTHEDLGKEILQAAKRLFLEQGYAKTSMRRIAADVGVSATSIYLYYKDKADIMHALHQEGFKILNREFKTLQLVEHPFERLKAMGRGYINFALENRGFYEIMFIMKEPLKHLEGEGDLDPGWEEGQSAFQALQNVISDCQEYGYFKGYNRDELALILWGNMHGLCALKNNGHLDLLVDKMGGAIEISEIMQNSFSLYTKMIENL